MDKILSDKQTENNQMAYNLIFSKKENLRQNAINVSKR